MNPTSTFLRFSAITLIAALVILTYPGWALAQSPPTGLVSINRLGNGSGNQPALNNALSASADGRYVAFVSEATDLALNDNNNAGDVFVRDRQTGQTMLVSVNAAGTGTADQSSRAPTISSDGRFVAFMSASSNLVADITAGTFHGDIYLRDLHLGTTTLVSRNHAGTGGGNGHSGWFDPLGISADGRFVVFTSSATDLVAAVDNNNQTDVFVRDLLTRTTALVSINRDGSGTGSSVSEGGVITPNGRFVGFLSQSRDLITMDIGFRLQVFIRDLQTGVIKLLTPNRLGTGGGNADTDARGEHNLTVSFDGRFVAFVSEASDLIDNDSNGAQDVFVHDTQLGVTSLVSVNSNGASGAGTSGQLAMTPDGHFVAFISGADNLAPGDSNLEQDVFVRDLQANSTTLISVDRMRTPAGNGNPNGFFIPAFLRPSISDNGRYVSFTSSANDMTFADDTNGGNPGGSLPDVFVRDRENATTTLVSVNNAGSDSGNGTSGYSVIARDGRSIFYFSGAGNLVSYDSNGGVQDLFVFVNVPEPGQVRFHTAITGADEFNATASVVVKLLGPPIGPVSINFSSVNGTATDGADYAATSGTLTFGPGETEKTFSVSLLDDSLDENDETVVLRLSPTPNGAPLGEPNISVLRIVDDDPPPTIRVNDITIAEGDTGASGAIFTISLSEASGRSLTVQFDTQGGTATSAIDFRQVSGQLTFLAGQTTRQISVAVHGDTAIEGLETFSFNLSNPVNAVITDGQGEGTIVDDDALILLTEANSERAIALDSVLFTRDPFPINNERNFSVDRRTRIALFAIGLKLLPGETASAVSATVEDSQGNVHPLTVEFVGTVPTFNWLTQINFRFNDQLTSSGDMRVRITLRAVTSNAASIGVQP